MPQQSSGDQIHLVSKGTTTFGIAYTVYCCCEEEFLVALRPTLPSIQPWHIRALTDDLIEHYPGITLDKGDALQRLRNRFGPEAMRGFAAGEVLGINRSTLGHVLLEIQRFHAPTATMPSARGVIAIA